MSKKLYHLTSVGEDVPADLVKGLGTKFKSWEIDQVEADCSDKGIRNKLIEADFTLVHGDCRMNLSKVVQHKTVQSHFLDFVDLVVNRGGVLWGTSVFEKVLRQQIFGSFEKQSFKGSVIFLGESPLVIPALSVLSNLGFADFDFLQLDDDNVIFDKVRSSSAAFLSTKTAKVDSTAFIRSQKEYSLCFVLKDDYSQQILDDMSYFHFLSKRSIVFDLAGRSNFLFKEVKALGVRVVEYSALLESYLSTLENELMTSS